MQDNEPLMRALSNLINLNQPDLVLFVGEALVGNDAVDQLTKFNQRLADLSPGPQQHLIDGIVLTKFDTIDDKVGGFESTEGRSEQGEENASALCLRLGEMCAGGGRGNLSVRPHAPPLLAPRIVPPTWAHCAPHTGRHSKHSGD